MTTEPRHERPAGAVVGGTVEPGTVVGVEVGVDVETEVVTVVTGTVDPGMLEPGTVVGGVETLPAHDAVGFFITVPFSKTLNQLIVRVVPERIERCDGSPGTIVADWPDSWMLSARSLRVCPVGSWMVIVQSVSTSDDVFVMSTAAA